MLNTRKNVLIDATGGKGWIGGLYYKKNMLFALLQNNRIREHYTFYVATDTGNEDIFFEFHNNVKICSLSYESQRERKLKLTWVTIIHNCSYVFPCFDERICKKLGIVGINWIPDFQHNHLPEMFTSDDLEGRNKNFKQMALSKFPLVLSSYDALSDFRKFYSETKKNVYVVPFVSYIEKEARLCTEAVSDGVLKEFNLKRGKYICVANQFWKHKNHIIIFETIKKMSLELESNTVFVFTGNPEDPRNPEYSRIIKEYIDDPQIASHIKMLGFLKRNEQIAILKNAKFLIQPSLFEGWGTVLEDAKVLDKVVILSDINVHREQMSLKSILFNPRNAEELAQCVREQLSKSNDDDMEVGIKNMYDRANEYSTEFEKLLSDLEGRK